MQTPKFISCSLAVTIHYEQVETLGGTAGIRDIGLLESALAQPQTTFGGELLHPTLYEQAAAYLFHLSRNHPFIDGNKRTALAIMITFLSLNQHQLTLSQDETYTLVMGVAQGDISKAELATFLEQQIQLNAKD